MSEMSRSVQPLALWLFIPEAFTLFYIRECISYYFALGFSKSAHCLKKARLLSDKYPFKKKISQKYMREHISNEYYLKKYDLYMRIKHAYVIFCAVSFAVDEIFIILSLYDYRDIYVLFIIKSVFVCVAMYVFFYIKKRIDKIRIARKPNKKNK